MPFTKTRTRSGFYEGGQEWSPFSPFQLEVLSLVISGHQAYGTAHSGLIYPSATHLSGNGTRLNYIHVPEQFIEPPHRFNKLLKLFKQILKMGFLLLL